MHRFHIPVMGTGFTIATPVKVARYGISSAISLVDDVLIERVRHALGRDVGIATDPIPAGADDARARRITAYLDLVDHVVADQIERLRESAFEAGSEITRYYRMLPASPLRALYEKMLAMADGPARDSLQAELRRRVTAGAIDVNIMTKLDRDHERGPHFSDALSALRGFAQSRVRGSVVLSAGLNRRLFSYFEHFDDFFPDAAGTLRKRITLKVSDFRSALIQGRLLAKKGLWVSEFRIESGLNCGGHAFGEKGDVLGPILDQFRRERTRLGEQLHALTDAALRAAGRTPLAAPVPLRITVQGGIGTAAEDRMLHEVYGVDGTGWGSPFLLVPEAVSLDDTHREKIIAAGEDDVQLSDNSPLGVPFWSLRTSASEEQRLRRIDEGRPGSACPKGYIRFNTDLTRSAVCTASRAYQRLRLDEIDRSDLAPEVAADAREGVVAKACICHELSGGAINDASAPEPEIDTAVCCGPNVVHFTGSATLDAMIDHIYGRQSLPLDRDRPHMFLKELRLHVDRLAGELDRRRRGLRAATAKSCGESIENLLASVEYYRGEARRIVGGQAAGFLAHLEEIRVDLQRLEQAIAVA